MSLIGTVRTKFLEAIRSVQPQGRWKILVVDDHANKLLSGVLKQFDILEENVTLIESITTHRDEQPGFEAIYILMPTTENIGRVIRDFDGKRQYAAAHIFFIEALPEALLERLFASPAEPYLKVVNELFLNFWPIEAQAYSLKTPSSFFSIYSPPRTEAEYKVSKARLEEDIHFMAKRIANLCITLNEYPYIRYYFPSHHGPLGPFKPHSSTRSAPPPAAAGPWRTNLARGEQAREYESVESEFIAKVLAFAVQSELDAHKKANAEYPKKSERGRGTLVITDRAMDPIAPFLHEFTYQAMVNDLLPIEDGSKYTYKFQTATGITEDKIATLTDADNVWTTVRHMHMREAIDKLMADFNKFLEENAGFKGEGAASLNDMKDMLANLPQYQEMREKFSLHLNMAEQSMGFFEKDKLPIVANVEQCCATGQTAEGKTPKTLVEDMVPLLDSREVSNPNKVRIIALYILHREGVPEEDKRRLYQHARLSMPEQDAVNALVYLGVRLQRGPGDKDMKRRIKAKMSSDEEYELSRFKPLLRTVLEEHNMGRLDPTLFPYVKDAPAAPGGGSLSGSSLSLGGSSSSLPFGVGRRGNDSPAVPPPTTSLRSAKANWHKAPRPAAGGGLGGAGAAGLPDNRQRLLVFVAGGMTYSEMREAYALSSTLGKEVLIGSTHTLTPRSFVDDLKSLELGGVGSRAAPNGMRNPDPARGRSYQEFYDETYFLKDPPPKARAPPPQQPERSRMGLGSSKPQPISQSNSYAGSTTSVASNQTGSGEKEEKEKKKKRNLFRF